MRAQHQDKHFRLESFGLAMALTSDVRLMFMGPQSARAGVAKNVIRKYVIEAGGMLAVDRPSPKFHRKLPCAYRRHYSTLFVNREAWYLVYSGSGI